MNIRICYSDKDYCQTGETYCVEVHDEKELFDTSNSIENNGGKVIAMYNMDIKNSTKNNNDFHQPTASELSHMFGD